MYSVNVYLKTPAATGVFSLLLMMFFNESDYKIHNQFWNDINENTDDDVFSHDLPPFCS